MQNMLNVCRAMAIELNINFNVDKSMFLRIGLRYSVGCTELMLCTLH